MGPQGAFSDPLNFPRLRGVTASALCSDLLISILSVNPHTGHLGIKSLVLNTWSQRRQRQCTGGCQSHGVGSFGRSVGLVSSQRHEEHARSEIERVRVEGARVVRVCELKVFVVFADTLLRH